MFEDIVETVGKATDLLGVAVIVVGVLVAAAISASELRQVVATDVYRSLRQRVGRAILLGLEILVAADIIRTVAVSPSLETAGVLAIIVLIRTVLSFSLEIELEGDVPWRRKRAG